MKIIEWKLMNGGNSVEVTTSFGRKIISRSDWIDFCREVFGTVPITGTDERGIILSTVEEEMIIMKKKFRK